MVNIYESLQIDIDYFVLNIIKRVTGIPNDDDFDYVLERKKLLENTIINQLVPSFIKSCRNLEAIWAYIQPKYQKYAQRREFIKAEFEPMLTYLENIQFENKDIEMGAVLKVGEEFSYIREYWEKSKSRIELDPEGAITSARTLIESCLKYILDSQGIEYKDNGDLNVLYKVARKELNLAPEQHNEAEFVKVLSGCTSIIGGISGIRNELSDSHGKKVKHYKPAARHAKLVVNLAGTMSEFLIDTYLSKFTKRDDEDVTV